MASSREFAKVSVDVFDHPAIRMLAAKHGAVAPLCWIKILCLAKEKGDEGRVIATPSMLGAMLGIRRVPTSLLQDFASHGLLDPVANDAACWRVVAWLRWQSRSVAAQKRSERSRADAGSTHQMSEVDENENVPRAPEEVEVEVEVEPLTLSKERGLPLPTDGPTLDALLEFWRTLFSRGSVQRSVKRDKAMRWALATYGREGVADCLRGYAADPWRHLDPNRNEIATLLKKPEQVEAGLELKRHGVKREGVVAPGAVNDKRYRSAAEMDDDA